MDLQDCPRLRRVRHPVREAYKCRWIRYSRCMPLRWRWCKIVAGRRTQKSLSKLRRMSFLGMSVSRYSHSFVWIIGLRICFLDAFVASISTAKKLLRTAHLRLDKDKSGSIDMLHFVTFVVHMSTSDHSGRYSHFDAFVEVFVTSCLICLILRPQQNTGELKGDAAGCGQWRRIFSSALLG